MHGTRQGSRAHYYSCQGLFYPQRQGGLLHHPCTPPIAASLCQPVRTAPIPCEPQPQGSDSSQVLHVHIQAAGLPATAGTAMHVTAPDGRLPSPKPSSTQTSDHIQPSQQVQWRVLRQSLLLGAAAFVAAPALLLLDIGEQAVLGMQRLSARAVSYLQPHACQQQHVQQDQQLSGLQQQPEIDTKRRARPLLPVWPPISYIGLALAPLGLFLLPGYQQCRTGPPVLLLVASWVAQAYLNLPLTVLARVKGVHGGRPAAPAWAPTPGSTGMGPQPAAAGQQLPAGGTVAVQLFSWLQTVGDLFRCACCCWMVWVSVAAAAVPAETASQVGSVSTLWAALQQCLNATSAAHLVGAAGIAAVAMRDVIQHWWSKACTVLMCGGSAAVYALSVVSRCRL